MVECVLMYMLLNIGMVVLYAIVDESTQEVVEMTCEDGVDLVFIMLILILFGGTIAVLIDLIKKIKKGL